MLVCLLYFMNTQIIAASDGFQLLVYDALIMHEDGTEVNETVGEFFQILIESKRCLLIMIINYAYIIIDETKNILQYLSTTHKPVQGLRANKLKYQVIKSVTDDFSGCFCVQGN